MVCSLPCLLVCSLQNVRDESGTIPRLDGSNRHSSTVGRLFRKQQVVSSRLTTGSTVFPVQTR